MVELAPIRWVPPPKAMVPAEPLKFPVCVPPLVRLRIPVSTSTLPELLKATPTVVVLLAVESDLRKVPALMKRESEPVSVLLK